jgi:transposase
MVVVGHGRRVVVVDSSPYHGWCGAKLRLSERTYRCGQCGLVMDRDLNAARNLARLVEQVIGGTSCS